MFEIYSFYFVSCLISSYTEVGMDVKHRTNAEILIKLIQRHPDPRARHLPAQGIFMTTPTSDISQLARQTINARYELLDTPREGSLAYVYQARDTHLDRLVALKLLKPIDARGRARLHAEAQHWAQLPAHPNVVHLLDHGVDDTRQIDYLAMDWVDGPNLDEWRGGPSLIKAIDDLLDLALWCSEGVRLVHQHGLVHGNLTPRNILLAKPNGAWMPKLADGGLAEGGAALKYAAPEQLEPGARIDARTDIYALGTVLFTLFSGSHYLGDIAGGEAEWRAAIRNKPALALQSVLGACNSDLNVLVAAMLQKEPRRRPTLDQVQDRLRSIQRRYAQPSQRAAAPAADIPRLDRPVELELRVSPHSVETMHEIIGGHLARHPQRGPELARVRDGDSLIAALVDPGAEYDCYVYNSGEGQNPGERRIVIRLATDTDNPANRAYYQPIQKTLELLCVQSPRQNHLFMLRASFPGVEDGQRKRNALIARFKFASPATGTRLKGGLPPEAIRQIVALPQGLEPDVQVQQRLQHWETYLNIWERAAREKEYVVKFAGWKRDPSHPDEVTFQLRGNVPWKLIDDSRRSREAISLRKYHEDYHPIDSLLVGDDPNAYEDIKPALGTIERVNPDRGTIQVVLDDDFIERHWDSAKNLPRIDAEGYLAYVSFGDLAQIRQQRTALTRLIRGDTTNWKLNQFIFDAGRADYPEAEGVHLRRDQLLLPGLNVDQFKAVEGALNAPDLYLIQGPPGTGKTTVIAELCYQFTRRGQRVLVSSQSNLAVDNALSRLAHHPHILALRIGREKSVEPEGEPFTEEKVVSTWFERTAQDCEAQLHTRQQQVDHFASLLSAVDRLERYADLRRDHPATLRRLEQAHRAAADALREADESRAHLEGLRAELPSRYRLLQQAAQAVQSGDVPPDEALPAWRSEVIDLVALPEYQDHLQQIAAGLKLLDELKVDTASLLARHLDPDERGLLRRLGEGDEEAGLGSHRPAALLVTGEAVYRLVHQHVADLRRLKTGLDRLDSHLRQAVTLRDQRDQIARLLTLIDLRDRLRTAADLLPEIRTLGETFRQAEQAHQHAADQLAQHEREVATAQEQIAALQTRLAERDTTAPIFKRMRAAIQTLIASEAAQSAAPYLPAVRRWIEEGRAEALTALPAPLAQAVRQHPWYGLAAVFDQLSQIALRAVNNYEKLLPAPYLEDIPVDTYDPALPLFQEVSALFVTRDNSRYPQDEARVGQQLSDLCERHLQTLRAGRDFEQGRDELGYLVLLQDRFEGLCEKHWRLCLERWSDDATLQAELQAIIDTLAPQQPALETQVQPQITLLVQQAAALDAVTGQPFGQPITDAVHALNWEAPRFTPLLDRLNDGETAVADFWNEQSAQLEALQPQVIRRQAAVSTAQADRSAAQDQRDQHRAQLDHRLATLAGLLHEQEPVPAASTLAAELRTALAHFPLAPLEDTARGVLAAVEQEITTGNVHALEADGLQRLAAQAEATLEKWNGAIRHELAAVDLPSLTAAPATLDGWHAATTAARAALEQHAQIASKLNTITLIKTLAARTRERDDELRAAHAAAVERREQGEQQMAQAAQQGADYQTHCRAEQSWWDTLHAAIPADLIRDLANSESIHQEDYLRQVLKRARTPAWEQALAHQTGLVRRTEPLVRDWITRLKENQRQDAEELRELYVANANVLGVTCGQVPRLTRRKTALSFDVVIVDEVSKATLPELLLPMAVGHKIILVGDHKQLPPMVQDNSLQEVAEQLKIPTEELIHFKQSLFGNLYNSAAQALRHMLTEQYRMRPAIMHAINQFYDHQLTGGHQRPHHLPVAGLDHDTALAWVTTPLDKNYYEVPDGSSFANPREVDLIEGLLDEMNTAWQPHVTAGEAPKEVGVITFYMAQFRLFRKRAWHTRFGALHIRIGTVDRFQGMERDVILVSLVRNNPYHNIGFAKEPERINVAFSRARELLVIVGCQALFAQSARHAYEATAAYAEIAKVVEREGKTIRV